MISILLATAMQAGAVPVQQHTITSRSPSYPSEIRVPVGNYLNCLTGTMSREYPPEKGAEELHREDVARCATARLSLTQDAVKLWVRGRLPGSAERAVARLFDDLAAWHIAGGVELDEMVNPSEPNSAPLPEEQSHPKLVEAPIALGSLTIPDDIAPTVLAYLKCRTSASGQEIRDKSGRVLMPANRGKDCSSLRVTASKDSLERLRRMGSKLNAQDRLTHVEGTLRAIDDFTRPKTEAEKAAEIQALMDRHNASLKE